VSRVLTEMLYAELDLPLQPFNEVPVSALNGRHVDAIDPDLFFDFEICKDWEYRSFRLAAACRRGYHAIFSRALMAHSELLYVCQVVNLARKIHRGCLHKKSRITFISPT